MRKKPGPKPKLNKALVAEIKKSILSGNNLKETAKVCGIPKSTFYTWSTDNYLNIAIKIDNWKNQRMIELAEGNIEDDLLHDPKFPEERRIRQKASTFVLETLAKEKYSKRSELTGGDGEPLGVVVLPPRNENTLDADKKTNGSTGED